MHSFVTFIYYRLLIADNMTLKGLAAQFVEKQVGQVQKKLGRTSMTKTEASVEELVGMFFFKDSEHRPLSPAYLSGKMDRSVMSGSFARRAALTSAASSVASGSFRRRASSK